MGTIKKDFVHFVTWHVIHNLTPSRPSCILQTLKFIVAQIINVGRIAGFWLEEMTCRSQGQCRILGLKRAGQSKFDSRQIFRFGKVNRFIWLVEWTSVNYWYWSLYRLLRWKIRRKWMKYSAFIGGYFFYCISQNRTVVISQWSYTTDSTYKSMLVGQREVDRNSPGRLLLSNAGYVLVAQYRPPMPTSNIMTSTFSLTNASNATSDKNAKYAGCSPFSSWLWMFQKYLTNNSDSIGE